MMTKSDVDHFLAYAEKQLPRREFYEILALRYSSEGKVHVERIIALRRVVAATSNALPLAARDAEPATGVMLLPGKQLLLDYLENAAKTARHAERERHARQMEDAAGRRWQTEFMERQKRATREDHHQSQFDFGPGKSTRSGWLYVLSNSELRGRVKIGMTRRHPDDRARELQQGTGVIGTFLVRYAWKVSDPQALEREVHEALGERRVSSHREFFRLKPLAARDAIEDVIRRNGWHASEKI